MLELGFLISYRLVTILILCGCLERTVQVLALAMLVLQKKKEEKN